MPQIPLSVTNQRNVSGALSVNLGGTGTDLSQTGGQYYFITQPVQGGVFQSTPFVWGALPQPAQLNYSDTNAFSNPSAAILTHSYRGFALPQTGFGIALEFDLATAGAPTETGLISSTWDNFSTSAKLNFATLIGGVLSTTMVLGTNGLFINSLTANGFTNGAGANIITSGDIQVGTATGSTIFFDGNYSYVLGSYIQAITTNTIGIFTAGTQRLRVLAGGNICIGTTTVANALMAMGGTVGAKLHLYDDNTNFYGFGIQANVLQVFVPATSNRVGFGIGSSGSFTENLSISGSGLITLYNNVATQGYGVPAIVARIGLTAQGADIADTNLTNAATAGEYEVGVYVVDTTADGTAGSITVNIKWSDGTAIRTTTTTVALTANGYAQSIVFIRNGGTNITYGVTHTGIYATAKYSLFITCKRLN